MYNPVVYIAKRKICKFNVCSTFSLKLCHSVFSICFVYAGTLWCVVYTYESVVIYAIILIG